MKNFIKNWGSVIIILVVVLAARYFIFTPITVMGHSMDPTLQDGQKLISSKISSYNRMDIITTVEPDEPETLIVKRLIGLPGDTVSMKNETLTINGKEYKEDYLDEFKKKFADDKLQEEYSYDEKFQAAAEQATQFTQDFEVTIPEGKYLVLGDNRLISKDSRIFGLVDKDLIQGKAVFRYWPLNEISLVN
ncbi:signal peptidase I [Enterococcus sp. JM4C]|uniref:signal peptidase I n=1 Tax=Candidatus Enterococcus huntleyi TaxID=1857217 RepID=UPI00137AB70D|nr:signal peptidase I [Enterococcus sp. JM4C]KAF1299284.1 signal peptidase I [Enterococcus sp. JM4C]